MPLARFAIRFPRLVLLAFVLSGGLAVVGALRLHETDDLLDFIPPGDADVRAFREVNKTFGALRVALVGVEAQPGGDVFSPDAIGRLDAVTRGLKAVRGVDRVVSL